MELWCDIFNQILPQLRNRLVAAVQNVSGVAVQRRLCGETMRSVDEYRRSAASMLDLAQRADSVADKNRLLVMA
jgi:hypothetical protein